MKYVPKTILSSLFPLWMLVSGGCASSNQPARFSPAPDYDMRSDLQPQRLTVAMWDFSWLNMHHPGGAFEGFDQATNELIERGFNTVRIDAFPLVIAEMKTEHQETYLFNTQPNETWGPIAVSHSTDVPAHLIEFLEITQRKKLQVILSSWNQGSKPRYADRQVFWKAWETTLDLLAERGLLKHVLYVDLDQEFPNFSPFVPAIKALGRQPTTGPAGLAEAMEDAGRSDQTWNPAQMAFIKDHLTSTLRHFQSRYPSARFTFSFTDHWPEVRAMKLPLDVLEVHVWMNLERVDVRTGFNALSKNRDPAKNYQAYGQKIRDLLQSTRPMLLKDMENQLRYVREWSREIPAPVVITESWGPWWHMDHPDLEWSWLYDWCEQCAKMAGDFGLWGITPWNFSHPYWKNWSNIEWYRRVNDRFLASPASS